MSADGSSYEPIGARCFRIEPDTPHPGVTFYDMQPLLDSPTTQSVVTSRLVNEMAAADKSAQRADVTHVVALEMRGLFLGTWLAQSLGVPLVPMRKRAQAMRLVRHVNADLVSSPLYGTEYSLASDGARLCVRRGALPAGARCLVVDDVLATGGSLRAAASVVEACGATVHSCAVLLAVTDKCLAAPVDAAPVYTCFETTRDDATPVRQVFGALAL